MKRFVSIFLILIIMLFNICSCGCIADFEFTNDQDSITSIEIVQIIPNMNSNRTDRKLNYIEYTLLTIEDRSSFLEEFLDLKYSGKSYVASPEDEIANSALAIKFVYSDFSYEVVNYDKRLSYSETEGYVNDSAFGKINPKSFYNFLFEHLSIVPKSKFNYIRPKESIVAIDIIETTKDDEKIITSIENIDVFLNELEKIEYSYVNYKFTEKVVAIPEDGVPLIKIIYNNGDYEILGYNTHSESTQGYDCYGTYIGTFNEEQFNALLEKYMQNRL